MDIMDMVAANMGDWISIVVFFAVFALIIGLAKAFLEPKRGGNRRRSSWDRRRKSNWKPPHGGHRDVASPADQLDIVMNANFQSRSLLNRPEAKVFKALDSAVIERNSGWQVMAQVSLGEFLSSKNKKAYACVNSKRIDFALMDENCQVVHALEYQGSGHHMGKSAAARDAVKKEALRKAGIGYHEIVAGHSTPSELRALVEKLVPAG